MEKKNTIVVFGGSFNPPLNSHFSIAQEVLNQFSEVEKIVFMPVNQKYSKKGLIENKHRYNMLKLVAEQNSSFIISDMDMCEEKSLTTIKILRELDKKFPDKNIWFLMGSDNLRELHTWEKYEDIVSKYKILVMERDKDNIEEIINSNKILKEYTKNIKKLKQAIKSNYNSTYVREQVKKGESIRYLLPDEVYEYIKRNGLYRESLMIKDIEKEVQEITKWIKAYVEKAHAKGVVVGNSGGKDSAVVIALATKALGKENVVTIAMPCNSIKDDFDDAKLVADTFEVPLLKVDLSDTYKTLENELDRIVKPKDEAKINAKPRLRMTTLYYVAQSLDYLVIGTGNKCESVVGYTTKWGDSAHDFNPIGDFTVKEVLQIGEYLGVPDKIIKKAPADGLGGLTDEQKLGVTYKQIAEYIENGTTDENALEIIKKKENISRHKREPIPVYKRNDKK